MKSNQPRPGLELVSPRPFPMTITITVQIPPYIVYRCHGISFKHADTLKIAGWLIGWLAGKLVLEDVRLFKTEVIFLVITLFDGF